MNIDQWAERVFQEEDFGRNVATSISGLIGLGIYLYMDDFPLSAFVTIISFPLIKVVSNSFREMYLRKKKVLDQEAYSQKLVDVIRNLSDDERRVIHEFVKHKSSVMSDSHMKMNTIFLPDGAVKSDL